MIEIIFTRLHFNIAVVIFTILFGRILNSSCCFLHALMLAFRGHALWSVLLFQFQIQLYAAVV